MGLDVGDKAPDFTVSTDGGVIRAAWRKVGVPGHVETVLEAAGSMA